MSLYEYERTKSALAEEKRKNKELARRLESCVESGISATHDLIDLLPGTPLRKSVQEDADEEGRRISHTIEIPVKTRIDAAVAHTNDLVARLKAITSVIVAADADDIARGALDRIPTPREIKDFEKRTKAEIARVQRQSRVDQAELLKVQEALVETGMPAGVTYRTWIAELQRKIDSAPPANTAREDRNAICELGDLLLSGTKDCYAASAVVRMVKHLLTRPAVVEALKEAHETSWEWVLERVPNTNNRSYAGIILDDPVQAPRVTQENVEKAQTWLRDRGRILGVAFGIGERPKHADGRLRWRHMVMPGLPFLAARNMPRWFRFAYLIASHLRSRGAATMKARAQ